MVANVSGEAACVGCGGGAGTKRSGAKLVAGCAIAPRGFCTSGGTSGVDRISCSASETAAAALVTFDEDRATFSVLPPSLHAKAPALGLYLAQRGDQ